MLKAHGRWVETNQTFTIDPKSFTDVEFCYYDQEDQPQIAKQAEEYMNDYRFSKLSEEEKQEYLGTEKSFPLTDEGIDQFRKFLGV